MQPATVRPVPPVYQTVAKASVNIDITFLDGTVRSVDPAHPSEAPKSIPPTTNGKSIVEAPHTKDAQGNVITLPARSSAPAQPHPGNPVMENKPVQKPSAPGKTFILLFRRSSRTSQLRRQ